MGTVQYPEPCARCMDDNPTAYAKCILPCVDWDKWAQRIPLKMVEVSTYVRR